MSVGRSEVSGKGQKPDYNEFYITILTSLASDKVRGDHRLGMIDVIISMVMPLNLIMFTYYDGKLLLSIGNLIFVYKTLTCC